MTSESIYTNPYFIKVQELSKDNKYLKWYLNICYHAQQRYEYEHDRSYNWNKMEARKQLGYTERHHILPESFNLGGEKDGLNFVFLTPKEHYIIHLVATMMFEGKFKQKMCLAFSSMAANNSMTKADNEYVSSRHYEFKRRRIGKDTVEMTVRGITFNSKTDAIRHFDVTDGTISAWIRKEKETGISLPSEYVNQMKSINIYGKEFNSWEDAGRYYKVKPDTLRRRIDKGLPVPDKDIPETMVHPNSKPVIWNGVEYSSQTEAARACGISSSMVGNRTNNPEVGTRRKGRRITVIVKGIEFESKLAASKYFKVSDATIGNWLKKEKEMSDGVLKKWVVPVIV
jgi:transposase